MRQYVNMTSSQGLATPIDPFNKTTKKKQV